MSNLPAASPAEAISEKVMDAVAHARAERISGSLAVGLGCRRNATPAALTRLVEQTLGRFALDPNRVGAVATLDERAGGVCEGVAQQFGVPLITFPAAVLAGVSGVQTRSMRVADAVGTPSVAEAAALAVLGSGARLVVPRQTGEGCTCAIAELLEESPTAPEGQRA